MEYNLERFVKAQESAYPVALQEIKEGRKQTHWIWYIFPQMDGLGISAISQYYAIGSIAEAKAYMSVKSLRENLLEISNELLKLETNDIREVMGFPDNLKLKSCMTLFASVAPGYDVFNKVLDKYYSGEKDENTMKILNKLEKKKR